MLMYKVIDTRRPRHIMKRDVTVNPDTGTVRWVEDGQTYSESLAGWYVYYTHAKNALKGIIQGNIEYFRQRLRNEEAALEEAQTLTEDDVK